MTEILIFVLVGILTLAMRGVFILGAVRRLPPGASEWLDNAKPAILAALAAGFLAGGEASVAVAPIAGLTVAALVMRRTHNMVPALAAGMLVVLVL